MPRARLLLPPPSLMSERATCPGCSRGSSGLTCGIIPALCAESGGQDFYSLRGWIALWTSPPWLPGAARGCECSTGRRLSYFSPPTSFNKTTIVLLRLWVTEGSL